MQLREAQEASPVSWVSAADKAAASCSCQAQPSLPADLDQRWPKEDHLASIAAGKLSVAWEAQRRLHTWRQGWNAQPDAALQDQSWQPQQHLSWPNAELAWVALLPLLQLLGWDPGELDPAAGLQPSTSS